MPGAGVRLQSELPRGQEKALGQSPWLRARHGCHSPFSRSAKPAHGSIVLPPRRGGELWARLIRRQPPPGLVRSQDPLPQPLEPSPGPERDHPRY